MLQIRRLIAMAYMAMVLAAPPGVADTRPININTASAAELASLKGIGEVKAQAIVSHREKNGSFKSIDDLKAVSGIGDKLMEQLRPQITIGSNEKNEPARKP